MKQIDLLKEMDTDAIAERLAWFLANQLAWIDEKVLGIVIKHWLETDTEDCV